MNTEHNLVIMAMPSAVPLSTYLAVVEPNIDRGTIDRRIQRGIWQLGVHIVNVDGVKERWVNIDEVTKWAMKNSSRAA
ncbi:excisionase [Aeromonas diversa]|uniref:excisionase n=1 Tax=Aeromonas diversa TaxID=502790 RepID=UPI0039A1A4DC